MTNCGSKTQKKKKNEKKKMTQNQQNVQLYFFPRTFI